MNLAAGFLLFVSSLQAHPSLAEYLQQHPWSPQTAGPMLVVNAGMVKATNGEGGFAAFDRQPISCGQLTVIAPTEMVIIDASLQDPPNLYEGLPIDDKILYLMKSLSPAQWQIACKDGIGLGDLPGEQKAVMNSIIPKPLVVTHSIASSDVGWSGGNDKETIPPEQAANVKLRFSRSVMIGVSFRDEQGYMAMFVWDHVKGDKILTIDHLDPSAGDSLFGVKVRQTLPNAEKPSQLDYKSRKLDATVKLPATAKLSSLVESASEATGLKIAADFRVGNLDVNCYGSEVKARDLLRGLARAVTSTYRKVGDRYLLTSDIPGIGSRRLAIAMWAAQVQDEVDKREKEWRAAIAKSAAYVTYNAADKLAPNDAMQQWMDAHNEPWGGTYMPATDMSPTWQAKLQQSAEKSQTHQALDGTKGGPIALLNCSLVLPDGRTVDQALTSVPYAYLRADSESNWKLEPNPVVKPITLDASSHASIAISANTPGAAGGAVSTAALYGFSELWLESTDPETLQEALNKARDTSVTVRLLVRPWEASKSQDPERTILGGQPAQALARMVTMPSWELLTEYEKDPPDQAPPLMSPLDPDLAGHWKAMQNLSKSEGLTGTVLCDTEPTGYEPERTGGVYGAWDRPISDSGHFGYSLRQRLEFLDKYDLDPIDIADLRIQMIPNLNPSFYDGPRLLNGVAWDSAEPYGGMTKLVETLSTANEAAIGQLVSMLRGPVLIERRRQIADLPPIPAKWVVPWNSGQNMPSFQGAGDADDPGPPGSICMVKVGSPMSDRVASGVWKRISNQLAANKAPVTVDMTGVPAEQVGVILKAWFISKALAPPSSL